MGNITTAMVTAALTTICSYALGYWAAKGIIPAAGVSELASAIAVVIVVAVGYFINERATKAREGIALNAGINASNTELGAITPLVSAASAPAVIAAFAPPKAGAPAPLTQQASS